MIELNQIINGDCIETMKGLPDNSVDSVVTDSPYGLSFMNKKWDTLTSKGLYDFVLQWSSECFRVLKPGGYILSFGGTRTYHRMTCAIEDAGFEIRDCIMWIYGSGFPKSLNIGKAIDKIQGNERELISKTETNSGGMANVNKVNQQQGFRPNNYNEHGNIFEVTKGNSSFEGWGTALKPACEPITVARKPLSEKTVAENILKWGTGGINIDGGRIRTSEIKENDSEHSDKGFWNNATSQGEKRWTGNGTNNSLGRFPANIILDKESGEMLDRQAGKCGAFAPVKSGQNGKSKGIYGDFANYNDGLAGASRFFYCAKTSKSERNNGCNELEKKERIDYGGFHSEKGLITNNRNPENRKPTSNNHPTVKPISLMRYLVRLVTQKGGVCLDPFGGSGTTGIACVMEGINYILIEKEPEYAEIGRARIKAVEQNLQLKLELL